MSRAETRHFLFFYKIMCPSVRPNADGLRLSPCVCCQGSLRLAPHIHQSALVTAVQSLLRICKARGCSLGLLYASARLQQRFFELRGALVRSLDDLIRSGGANAG